MLEHENFCRWPDHRDCCGVTVEDWMIKDGRMSVEDVTSPEARDIHAAARASDPDHDMGGCWCCCLDCDFDAQAVCANDEAAGIETVV